MKALLLRLEGPLQAWSTQSKLLVRDTDREPSKSAVIGLIGAALGMERDDDGQLAKLRELSFAVRVDRPGTLLRDYHTAGGGRFRGRGDYFVFNTKDCVPSERYYLQDACFTAALAGEATLVEHVAAAVRSPRWPIFLGRRSCPPSAPLFLGVVDGDARQAVRDPAFLCPARSNEPEVARLRLLVEAPPSEGGEPRYDDPISFRLGARKHAVRYVKTEWLERAPAELHSEGTRQEAPA
jgi:CRISPR system Cascade subunit CasD